MAKTTCVNLHCHSTCSDGVLTPEQLAERLIAAGARYAALTDHDTTAGFVGFRDVLARRGVGVVTGVEMTTMHAGASVHLLGYGFDPAHEELQRRLGALRRYHDVGVQALVGSLRKIGSRLLPDGSAEGDPAAPEPAGPIEASDAIALIHQAGGRVFLAHPMETQPDPALLESLLADLKAHGLDGIEALYLSYGDETRSALLALALKHGLLVAAGTDFHDPSVPGHGECVMEMPSEMWKAFRNGLQRPAGDAPTIALPPPEPPHRPRRRNFVLRIGLPTLLAIGLFVGTIFALIIPQFEAKLLDWKRDMIRELTNSAWSILAEYEKERSEGRFTLEQAQAEAKERIEFLRYGAEGKDYFWITDMHPTMVMHPYRPDLNGSDLTDFTDKRGDHIFVKFADLARRKKEGYVEYFWQWKDDPGREAEKESYIKAF